MRRREAGRTGGRRRRCGADPGGRRRAIPGLRPMRRPRVCLASRLPGGAGAPPGGTTAPRQELADGRAAGAKAPAKSRTKSAARRRSWGSPWRSPRGAPGGAAPGPSIPERECLTSVPRRVSRKDLPRGAPAPRRLPALHSPHVVREGKGKRTRACPGPTSRIRAMTYGCLTFEYADTRATGSVRFSRRAAKALAASS
jgi:hypothetical protein